MCFSELFKDQFQIVEFSYIKLVSMLKEEDKDMEQEKCFRIKLFHLQKRAE